MKLPKIGLSWIMGIGLMLGGTSSISLSAQELDYLNVHTIGGENIYSFPLNSILKITFEDSQATLWCDNGEQSILYTQLDKITFGESLNAIEEIESTADLQIIYHSGNRQIEVTSALSINEIAIYNTQGRLMLQLSPRSETTWVELDNLPAGLYIVRAANTHTVKTQKIIKH